MLSAILYCFYMNGLFTLLRERKSGCWVGGVFFGMIGYSDDNWILAPSRSALQEMLSTCEEYAMLHNLKFSTDPNPTKCKTKCIAFLKKPRDLSPVMLCGNPLPWVESGKHLGNFFSNKIDGMRQDIRVKRAKYIDRCNELLQEFHFAHPRTKLKMMEIYNSHFTGSPLWDLFSPEAVMLENTWNRNVRLTFDLPLQTHRYFVCPMSESPHLRFILMKRFLSFIKKLELSTKPAIRHLYGVVQKDVQSITGSNIKKILMLLNKEEISQVAPSDTLALQYNPVTEENEWRIKLLKELVEIRHGNLNVDLSEEEINEIITDICTT